MIRGLRLIQSATLAIAILSLMAVPALAVSQITNSLTISPRTFGSGWNVDVQAKTVYDNFPVPPTIYPSNFVIAANYAHLRSPSIYNRIGPSGNFTYQSSVGVLSNQAGYYFQNTNALWVLSPVTWEIDATFHSYQATPCFSTSRQSFHGQTDKWYNSSGPDVYITTTTLRVC